MLAIYLTERFFFPKRFQHGLIFGGTRNPETNPCLNQPNNNVVPSTTTITTNNRRVLEKIVEEDEEDRKSDSSNGSSPLLNGDKNRSSFDPEFRNGHPYNQRYTYQNKGGKGANTGPYNWRAGGKGNDRNNNILTEQSPSTSIV